MLNRGLSPVDDVEITDPLKLRDRGSVRAFHIVCLPRLPASLQVCSLRLSHTELKQVLRGLDLKYLTLRSSGGDVELVILPHAKTVKDSGFHAKNSRYQLLDSGFQSLSRFWIR